MVSRRDTTWRPPARTRRGTVLLLSLVSAASAAGVSAQIPPDQVPPDTVLQMSGEEHFLGGIDEEELDPHELETIELETIEPEPVDINRAAVDELAHLPGLSPAAARALVDRREARGPYPDVAALVTSGILRAEDMERAHPYLVAGSGDGADRRSEGARPVRGTFAQGYAWRSGERTTGGAGLPGRLQLRLGLRRGDGAAAHLALESDPEEPYRWEPRRASPGFDFASGHVVLRTRRVVRQLVVGDYTIRAGLGLVLASGGPVRPSLDRPSSLADLGRGLAPYRSTREYAFFRGTALRLARGRLETTLALSHHPIDAEPLGSGAGAPRGSVRLVSPTGMHRTAAERRRRHGTSETTVGAVVGFGFARWRLGTVMHYSRLAHALYATGSVHPGLASRARAERAASLFLRGELPGATLVAEAAVGGRHGTAILAGWTARWGRSVEWVVLGRRYAPAFLAVHGRSLARSGDSPQNEQGLYVALVWRDGRSWHAAAAVDGYQTLLPGPSLPRPGRGRRGDLRILYAPRPWLAASLQLRARYSDERERRDVPGLPVVDALRRRTRSGVRAELRYAFSPKVTMITRAERAFSRGGGRTTRGVLLYHDLRLRAHVRLRLSGRLTLFETDGYDARLYALEQDVAYVWSAPALTGQGQRAYLLAEWSPFGRVTVQVKWAVTSRLPEHAAWPGDPVRARGRELRLVVRYR